MNDPFAAPRPEPILRAKPPLCGDRWSDALVTYRCDLYRDHHGDHHKIGTSVYWPKERA